jgi:uncharacterized protein YndB with AHSA1/START domain
MPTSQGYLLLADISGYTSYLAGVELDHAQAVLTELLETIIGNFKALLTISKLEGDAVFAYVASETISRGEILFELVETTYAAFRDRVEGVRRRTTCTCNACRAIPNLDLKFILHRGEYMVQSIAGIHELVGSDVNLVHRLLKNHVGEATGWKAYALITNPALERLGLPCDRNLLYVASETYEHLGEIDTFSLNLSERYQARVAARRVVLEPEDADTLISTELAAPPAVVWDWLNDPQRRNEWMAGTVWTALDRPGGRTDVGAKNHCAHGKNESSRENILDWKPFEYFTTDQVDKTPLVVRMTYALVPLDSGQRTRLTVLIRFEMKRMPRLVLRQMCRRMLAPKMQLMVQALTQRLAGGLPAAADAPPERSAPARAKA